MIYDEKTERLTPASSDPDLTGLWMAPEPAVRTRRWTLHRIAGDALDVGIIVLSVGLSALGTWFAGAAVYLWLHS
jgi:hypothetical protein